MSDIAARPRWRVLFTPRWLSWHVFAVLAFVGMWWLGDWQLHRALDGNDLSWAYTFEWPIFAVFGAVFWVKTVKDELHPAPEAEPEEIVLPEGAGSGPVITADGVFANQGTAGSGRIVVQAGHDNDDRAGSEADVELAEYNAYLARLNKEVKGHGRWHGLR
jgi:hypothetical protein